MIPAPTRTGVQPSLESGRQRPDDEGQLIPHSCETRMATLDLIFLTSFLLSFLQGLMDWIWCRAERGITRRLQRKLKRQHDKCRREMKGAESDRTEARLA